MDPNTATLLAAVLGALIGGLIGYWATLGAARRTELAQEKAERAQIHARLSGLARLLGQLNFSRFEAQAHVTIFQAIPNARRKQGVDEGREHWTTEARLARDRGDAILADIERANQQVAECLARIPFLFVVGPKLREQIARLKVVTELSPGVKVETDGKTDAQLLLELVPKVRAENEAWASANVRAPIQAIVDDLADQLRGGQPMDKSDTAAHGRGRLTPFAWSVLGAGLLSVAPLFLFGGRQNAGWIAGAEIWLCIAVSFAGALLLVWASVLAIRRGSRSPVGTPATFALIFWAGGVILALAHDPLPFIATLVSAAVSIAASWFMTLKREHFRN